jgi:hypothetical protein
VLIARHENYQELQITPSHDIQVARRAIEDTRRALAMNPLTLSHSRRSVAFIRDGLS